MNRDVCEHFNPVDLPCEKCSVQKSTLREAAQQALEALLTYEQYIQPLTNVFGGPRVPEEGSASAKVDAAITALRAALAEPVQEPVAWMVYTEGGTSAYVTDNPNDLVGAYRALPLYTAPPQRRPLTDEEIRQIALDTPIGGTNFARAIERAHGIGEQQ